MEIVCFFIGVLYCYTLNSYLLLVVIAFFYLKPSKGMLFFAILGFLIAWLHQYQYSATNMPLQSMIPEALIEGRIDSIPAINLNKTSFTFVITKIDGQQTQGLAQLNWYQAAPILHAGQSWQLRVRLKKAHNFSNPGSFDYETMLTTRHIHWIGSVLSKNNKLLSQNHSMFDLVPLREHLSKKLRELAPTARISGIIDALTLNLTTHISQDDWNLFRRTGTTHLFGISGEHIALLSGLAFWLARRLWSLSAFCCLHIPAQVIAAFFGVFLALSYTFLAGFAPPVLRALIGCFFYALASSGRQQFTPWQVWRYTLIGVLCLEPHAVFMQGFYFSFLAVVCLFLTQKRWNLKAISGNLALQLSCLIGLMPLSLYWFSYGSLNGFFANLFAIPLVGFIIIPLCLFLMVFNSCSWVWVFMMPLDFCLNLMFQGLGFIERLAAININWSLGSIEWVIAWMLALLLVIALPVRPFISLASVLLILPLIPASKTIETGELLVQVLDVGQGLAVSIQTQNHILLYDTGDQLYQGCDLGTMVILPFYQAKAIKKIDKIVISHPDKDHRGGLKSVQEAMEVGELLVNEPKVYIGGINCHTYPPWDWDGVHFRFLPILANFPSKNNNSCILQISNNRGRVLLAGDIEKVAEDYLVRTYGDSLASEILIVPHHGSKTSSSYRFLLDVSPKYAIASLGFNNKFHFPHEQTLATMHALGIYFMRTDECGMVSFKVPALGAVGKGECFRIRSS